MSALARMVLLHMLLSCELPRFRAEASGPLAYEINAEVVLSTRPGVAAIQSCAA